jgi:hypothetical protein
MKKSLDMQTPAEHPKKLSRHERIDEEIKSLHDAGIKPDETHSQDADRHLGHSHTKIK